MLGRGLTFVVEEHGPEKKEWPREGRFRACADEAGRIACKLAGTGDLGEGDFVGRAASGPVGRWERTKVKFGFRRPLPYSLASGWWMSLPYKRTGRLDSRKPGKFRGFVEPLKVLSLGQVRRRGIRARRTSNPRSRLSAVEVFGRWLDVEVIFVSTRARPSQFVRRFLFEKQVVAGALGANRSRFSGSKQFFERGSCSAARQRRFRRQSGVRAEGCNQSLLVSRSSWRAAGVFPGGFFRDAFSALDGHSRPGGPPIA